MSYLIKNGEVVAETSELLESGSEVNVAYQTSREAINADREINLVNAFTVKASNAKKWADRKHYTETVATKVNEGEYLLS